MTKFIKLKKYSTWILENMMLVKNIFLGTINDFLK